MGQREREREMGKKLITGTKESLSRTLGEILPCRSVLQSVAEV